MVNYFNSCINNHCVLPPTAQQIDGETRIIHLGRRIHWVEWKHDGGWSIVWWRLWVGWGDWQVSDAIFYFFILFFGMTQPTLEQFYNGIYKLINLTSSFYLLSFFCPILSFFAALSVYCYSYGMELFYLVKSSWKALKDTPVFLPPFQPRFFLPKADKVTIQPSSHQ